MHLSSSPGGRAPEERLLDLAQVEAGQAREPPEPDPARLAAIAHLACRLHRQGTEVPGAGEHRPAEAERLAVLAREAADQRWQNYEEMASRHPVWFPADARRSGDPVEPADEQERD